MEPWQTLVLVGAAIAGYGWLLPQSKKGETSESNALPSDEAYDRLLEDLETENRELVDAVASFKKEQDETVRRLGMRIRELEAQVGEWKSLGAAAGTRVNAYPEASAERPAAEPASAERRPAAEPASTAERPEPAAAAASERGQAASAQEPISEEAAALVPQTIRSRYAELLELHGRGRSVEQIAKTLGLNKGEVQLILQLAKREEEQHA